MLALTDCRRRRLLQAAAALCAIPAFLFPLACRSAYDTRSNAALPGSPFSLRPTGEAVAERPVRVDRDPFAGDAVTHAAAPPGPTGSRECAAAAVRAIIIAASPHALLDCGNQVRVVGEGDALAGSRILKISASGIVLTGNTVLKVGEARP